MTNIDGLDRGKIHGRSNETHRMYRSPITSTSSLHTNLPDTSIKRPVHHAHYIPILLGIFPYILSGLFGHSETWMNVSSLLVMAFWLYVSLKLPWDFYYFLSSHPESSLHSPFKQTLLGILKTISVLILFLSPIVAVQGIWYFRITYEDAKLFAFLSEFNSHLFLLAALIPPFKHFFGNPPHPEKSSDHTVLVQNLTNRIIYLEELVDQLSQKNIHISKEYEPTIPPDTGVISSFLVFLYNLYSYIWTKSFETMSFGIHLLCWPMLHILRRFF